MLRRPPNSTLIEPIVPAPTLFGSPFVAALIEARALDPDYPVRGRAAGVLGRLGPVTGEVVPALAEALAWDQHLMVRWRAAAALARIGSAHAEAAGQIASLLTAALACAASPGPRDRAAHTRGRTSTHSKGTG